MILKDICSLKEANLGLSMANLGSVLKSRDIILLTRIYIPSYGFSSSRVWVWELDHKEGWTPKNWCFWTVVLENTWESLGLQGEQTSYSCRKLVLNIHWEDWCWSWSSNTWPTWCEELTHWKRPDAGKDWRQEETGMDVRGWDGWMVSPTRLSSAAYHPKRKTGIHIFYIFLLRIHYNDNKWIKWNKYSMTTEKNRTEIIADKRF